jgi:inorganic pyrophosphatase
MTRKRKHTALANPVELSPVDKKDEDQVVVIIETPKHSRNKYAFDPDEKIFTLKTVLPAGMSFPYDFGFVPSTLGGDGDPLDVLVLMDEPAFPGCRLSCRPVGVIEGEQEGENGRERNDRLVCVEHGNHSFSHVKRIDDMGPKFEDELEEFFVNYHRLSGRKYRILAMKGPNRARRCIKEARKAARGGKSQ